MDNNRDVVKFCQSDLKSLSFAAFDDMRKSVRFCDLTVKVGNHAFRVHRIILVAAIPYFQYVFRCSESEMGKKEITVDDLDPRAVESLIDFAYSSEVNITSQNVRFLLEASQFFHLKAVAEACVQFLTERLQISNVTEIRAFACTMNIPFLIEDCNSYIQKNFEEFSKCSDFLSLPDSCIKAVIPADNLNVSNEEVLFEAIIKWIRSSRTERHVMLPDLLKHVRLIYLSDEYLINKIGSEPLIQSSVPCKTMLDVLLGRYKKMSSVSKTWPRNHWKHIYAVYSYDKDYGPSVNYLDLLSQVWRPLSVCKAKGEAACGTVHCVVPVNEKVFMFLESTILTFSMRSHEWEVLKPRHQNIKGAAIAAHGNIMYCFGSEDYHSRKKMRCFDSELREWLEEKEMNTIQYHSAAVSVGECIYVTGSYDMVVPTKYLSSVGKYSPATDQWNQVAPMLTPRCKHGCTATNGKIYVCGGQNSNGILNSAEVYDPVTDQWNLISPRKNEVWGTTLISHCNRIYALANFDNEIYDIETDQWKPVSSDVVVPFPGTFSGALSIGSAFRYP